MSDLLKAIHDDTERYESLCRHFGEEPQKDGTGISPYSEHAHELEKRFRSEEDKKRSEMVESSPEFRRIKRMLQDLLGRIEDKKLTRLISVDSALKSWWSRNRKDYDQLIRSGKKKLNPGERKAFGVK